MAAAFYADRQLANDEDNVPRNRASKSMDLGECIRAHTHTVINERSCCFLFRVGHIF